MSAYPLFLGRLGSGRANTCKMTVNAALQSTLPTCRETLAFRFSRHYEAKRNLKTSGLWNLLILPKLFVLTVVSTVSLHVFAAPWECKAASQQEPDYPPSGVCLSS